MKISLSYDSSRVGTRRLTYFSLEIQAKTRLSPTPSEITGKLNFDEGFKGKTLKILGPETDRERRQNADEKKRRPLSCFKSQRQIKTGRFTYDRRRARRSVKRSPTRRIDPAAPGRRPSIDPAAYNLAQAAREADRTIRFVTHGPTRGDTRVTR